MYALFDRGDIIIIDESLMAMGEGHGGGPWGRAMGEGHREGHIL